MVALQEYAMRTLSYIAPLADFLWKNREWLTTILLFIISQKQERCPLHR